MENALPKTVDGKARLPRAHINRVAVLGAGKMGAQIAAHLVNAGIGTVLFDFAAEKGDPNAIVKGSIQALANLKPFALGIDELVGKIIPANYSSDLEKLRECDLIIEAIADKIEFKQNLYDKIASQIAPHTILATNTSSLSIRALSEKLPQTLKPRFMGVHFFNPPRYMKLVELIPTEDTDVQCAADVERFLTLRLGKGVIKSNDTPAFIGYRVGIFALLASLFHAKNLNISPDRVDAVMAIFNGLSNTGPFQNIDLIGLDTFKQLVQTLKARCAEDPFHSFYEIPPWIQQLIDKGWLGLKTQKGFYKRSEEGLQIWDEHDKAYRPVRSHVDSTIKKILTEKNLQRRFETLRASKIPEVNLVWRIYRDFFHYCAYHLKTIAQDVSDVDLAMRWGFQLLQGPFELWQEGQWQKIAQTIQEDIEFGLTRCSETLPGWVFEQSDGPYPLKQQGDTQTHHRLFPRRGLIHQQYDEGHTIFESASVRMWVQQDNLPVLSINTPHAVINTDVLEGVQEALRIAQADYHALIFWQRYQRDFSFGADLKQIISLAESQNFEQLERLCRFFQNTALLIKTATIPTVLAVSGLTLGAGCEWCLHTTARVAAFESYIGQVDVAVGLIAAGGGTTALVHQALHSRADPEETILQYFDQMLFSKTSSSALEAKRLGYLCEHDEVVMNTDELLFRAKRQALALIASPYEPPGQRTFQVLGKPGYRKMMSHLEMLREEERISPYDYHIGIKLAYVMCGGLVQAGSELDDMEMLALEREAVISLLKDNHTQNRIKYTLEKGLPLKN